MCKQSKKIKLISTVLILLLMNMLSYSNHVIAFPNQREIQETTLSPRLFISSDFLRIPFDSQPASSSIDERMRMDILNKALWHFEFSGYQRRDIIAAVLKKDDRTRLRIITDLCKNLLDSNVNKSNGYLLILRCYSRVNGFECADLLNIIITEFKQAGDEFLMDSSLINWYISFIINDIIHNEIDNEGIRSFLNKKLPRRIVQLAFLINETYNYDLIQEHLFSVARDINTHILSELILPVFDDAMYFNPITLPKFLEDSMPSVNWGEFKKEVEQNTDISVDWSKAKFISRSLIVPIKGMKKNLVIKLARAQQFSNDLLDEQFWYFYLRLRYPEKFNVLPEPLKIQESLIFKLFNLPVRKPKEVQLHPEGYAIAFIIDDDYNFKTINDPNFYTANEFIEGIDSTAEQLGSLGTLGVFHNDIIPMFHNRPQQSDRLDNGRYDVTHEPPGRLDRWLHSTDWPNWWINGIRDAEHLEYGAFYSIRDYYEATTSALLGLHLSAGSYFRNKDRSRVGFTADMHAYDTRDLFDSEVFQKALETIYASYAKGLDMPLKSMPYDLAYLAKRMTDEMGIDLYMNETLRFNTHNRMSDEEFMQFFLERGYSVQEIRKRFLPLKGEEDIALFSGPHLGGFNQEISLPEMIDSIRVFSLMCSVYMYKTRLKLQTFPGREHIFKTHRMPQAELFRMLLIEQSI